MKNASKLLSVLLVLVLVISLAVPAMAEDSYIITVDSQSPGHQYEGYQIFKGDLHINDEDEAVLSNVVWGDGINTTGLIAALKAMDAFSELSDDAAAADVAKALDDQSAEVAKAFAKVIEPFLIEGKARPFTENKTTSGEGEDAVTSTTNYTLSVADSGYYFVRDKENSLSGKNDSATPYILQVVKSVEVTPKSQGVPTLEKWIVDYDVPFESDSTLETQASCSIGKAKSFRVVCTLPDNLDEYETYALCFYDVLPAGLTLMDGYPWFNIDDSADLRALEVERSGWNFNSYFDTTVTPNADGTTTIRAYCENIKPLIEDTGYKYVYMGYSAMLNENAVVGSAGNTNTAWVEYSNDPNAGSDGSMGKTPEDTATVYTFDLTIEKTDEEGTPLPGAGFKLEKFPIVYGEGAARSLNREWGETARMDTLPSGMIVRRGKEMKFLDAVLEALRDEYHYLKEEKWLYVGSGIPNGWYDIGQPTVKEFTAGELTTFDFSGLGSGVYRLSETTTPPGYNSIDPILFVVYVDYTTNGPVVQIVPDPENTTEVVFEQSSSTSGKFTLTIENRSGAILPSTGGEGVTGLYATGAFMLLAAAYVLLAKKRKAA